MYKRIASIAFIEYVYWYTCSIHTHIDTTQKRRRKPTMGTTKRVLAAWQKKTKGMKNSTQLIAYTVNQSDIHKYITYHISEGMNKNFIQTSENIKNH